jgi:hypothetical protein
VKRFSFKAFIVAALTHLAGTVAILLLGAHSLALYQRGVPQSRVAFECLTVWEWICSPLAAWLARYSLDAAALVFLSWSLVVGGLAGFIVPRAKRRSAVPSNQSLEPTAGRCAERLKDEL